MSVIAESGCACRLARCSRIRVKLAVPAEASRITRRDQLAVMLEPVSCAPRIWRDSGTHGK
jgi:hypothetical protein